MIKLGRLRFDDCVDLKKCSCSLINFLLTSVLGSLSIIYNTPEKNRANKILGNKDEKKCVFYSTLSNAQGRAVCQDPSVMTKQEVFEMQWQI